MNLVDDINWIKPMLARPPGPDARYDRRGIDQDSIHIKQEGFAGDFRHGK
jgi:hypothetical protein